MIPLGDRLRKSEFPWVTITLIGLLASIYLWDREWRILGPRILFSDLAARPIDVVTALRGGDKEPVVTLFTSAFLHGNLQHILFNLLYLWVFAPAVESFFGPVRFALYYMFWGVFAALTQIFVDPSSGVAMLGASGAIAGVMGAYLVLFPSSVIDSMVPPFYFWRFPMPAWLMLGMWFLFQIFFAVPGVANWAHAGGFLAGMLVGILVGGGKKPIKNGAVVA